MPKLNLRDLFWLVFVAGLGLAWWIERSQSAAPRIAVSETFVDFGLVDADSNCTAVFEIENTGGAPLEYLQGETSNYLSAAGDGEPLPVPPGETADFRVQWRASGQPGTQYVGHVELHTNDPCQKRLTLVVVSRIAGVVGH